MATPEPRDPFSAALGAVRRLAGAGRFGPGEAIIVTELAAEVGFSPTPMREALACLAGEGPIDRRRGRGYFYPSLSTADRIDLFELQLAYLHAALTLCPRGLTSLRKAAVAIDPLDGVQALFAAIVNQSANAALIAAHQRLIDRLKSVLALERTRDEPDGAPVTAMVQTIGAGDIPALLGLLEAYHERRCARAAWGLDAAGGVRASPR